MITVTRPGFPDGYDEAEVTAALAGAGYTLVVPPYGHGDKWKFVVDTTEANRTAVEALIDGVVDTTAGIPISASRDRTPVVLTGDPYTLISTAEATTMFSWSIPGGLRGLEIAMPFHYLNNTGNPQDLIMTVKYATINLLDFRVAGIATHVSVRAGFLHCQFWHIAPAIQNAVAQLTLAAPTTSVVEYSRMNDYFGNVDSTIQQTVTILATLGAASGELFVKTGPPLVRYL